MQHFSKTNTTTPAFLALPLAFLLASGLAPGNAQAQSGASLFEENCATCHLGDARGDERVAPPVFAVQNHYFGQHKSEAEFVNAVVKWLEEPSEEKSLMPGAISRFGLMPPVKLTDNERVEIATFLYSAKFDQPGWYEEHYRAEHGEAPPSGKMRGHNHMDHGGHGQYMGQGRKMGEGHQGQGHQGQGRKRLQGE